MRLCYWHKDEPANVSWVDHDFKWSSVAIVLTLMLLGPAACVWRLSGLLTHYDPM